MTQYKNPPLWEDKAKKEMKPGFPKIPNDVPMFRCVTADEAEELHNRGRTIRVRFASCRARIASS